MTQRYYFRDSCPLPTLKVTCILVTLSACVYHFEDAHGHCMRAVCSLLEFLSWHVNYRTSLDRYHKQGRVGPTVLSLWTWKPFIFAPLSVYCFPLGSALYFGLFNLHLWLGPLIFFLQLFYSKTLGIRKDYSGRSLRKTDPILGKGLASGFPKE